MISLVGLGIMSRRRYRKSPYGILSRVGLFGLLTESLGFGYLVATSYTSGYPDIRAISLAVLAAVLGQYLMLRGSGWGLRVCSGFTNALLAGVPILLMPLGILQSFLLASIFLLVGYYGRQITEYWRMGHFPPGGQPFFRVGSNRR